MSDLEQELPSWVTGSLTEIKEQKDVLPPTQNLKVKIVKCDINSEDKSGNPRTWKWLSPKFEIVDGVMIDNELKFKGKIIFGDMICYYADYNFYVGKEQSKQTPSKQPYDKKIKTGQHLIELSKFAKATSAPEIKPSSINGLKDSDAAIIAENSIGKIITIFVGQRTKDGITENFTNGYKKVDLKDLV